MRPIETLKEERKNTAKHIGLDQLSESARFAQLAPVRKQFLDTIKMISYRGETALAILLRDVMARPDDARSLLREIFTTEADLLPDEQKKTLTVRIHHLTNKISDSALQHLVEAMNRTETVYPGTQMRLVYELGTSKKSAPE